jgi:N-acetylmuramoyl-L-alanine amidase
MVLAARLLRAFCSRSRRMPASLELVAWGAILSLTMPVYAAPAGYQRPSYERAERLREALETRPESQRTRLDYNRVLNAFRVIYHANPAASKADASVLAVAGLLAEEGRIFASDELLRAAITQYEYLRTQYPATPYRFTALLSEGEIYRRDLHDRENAKQKFQLFLSSYPENPLAEQARIQLNDILSEEHPPKRHSAERNAVLAAAVGSQQQPRPATAMTPPPIQPQQVLTPSHPPPAMTPPAIEPTTPSQPEAAPSPVALALPPGQIALVSGIRHWSTPVYTRIAIDLQNQVAYQAARVPSPDRIYFDLYGARLEPGLNGKSVEVIDDGFLKRIRAAQFSNNVTRIVLDVSSVSDYSAFLLPNPWRLIIDVHGLKPGTAPTTNLASVAAAPAARSESPATNSAASPPPPATPRQNNAPVTPPAARHTGSQEIASLGQQPNRVQATDHPTTRPIAASVAGTVPAPQPDDGSLSSTTPPPGSSHKKPSAMHLASPGPSSDDSPPAPMHEATPTAAGERSLVRTLGLKIGRIVIDAGHGGHDSGTVGPGGIEEKQVVLDVALRLGKLLRQRLGADVIFTRDDDTFIPLETRTAIANKAQADLFLSIHANSSPDSSARGVETYYLNFTTSPDALEVAARENAVSDESIHELSDLVKKITLKDKIDESREFAADVQKSLYDNLEEGNPGLRDRGIKKAPFVVLIGANMPSILAEISFLTNSDDARELQQPAYRQRIAESLYNGVARYISGLSGVRLAQSASRPTGN